MNLLPPPVGDNGKREKKSARGVSGIPYDYATVEKLGAFMATNKDIAGWFDVTERTVERWRAADKRFLRAYERGLAKTNVSLRMKQRELALAGNPALLIWLGKNALGQSDRLQSEHAGKEGGPIQIAQIDAIIKDARVGE